MRPRENIRPRERFNPERPIQNFDHNINNIQVAQVPVPAVIMQDARLAPPKFSVTGRENGWFWLRKFEAYCNRQNIAANDRLEAVIVMISGPCENWFMLLPDNQKDTYDHLRAAFLARYENNNDVIDRDLFYTKKQKPNESVTTYINDMMSLGNKLHIDANNMIATIKRGLLEPIKVHVLSHDVNDIQTLLQQALLAETYLLKPQANTSPRVHFDTSVNDYSAPFVSNKTEQQMAELQYSNIHIKNMI